VLHRLKALRVVVSVAFFVAVASLFLDFGEGSAPLARSVLFLQFVPSVLQFVHTAALGATGFLAVLVFTALFGRVYCSSVCPLGTLQDAVSRTVRGRRSRYGHRYVRPRPAVRYAILGATLLLLVPGSVLMLNLLDPYSAFGRIMANLVRPVAIAANNLSAVLLEQFGIYALARQQWGVVAPLSAGVALATLALVTRLSARHGRLYCNFVCPVGTLLGLVSRASCLRIGIDARACTRCRRCEDVCKAGCIDLDALTVDASRCVSCFNCLASCPHGAMGYRNAWKRSPAPPTPDTGRRDFLMRSGMSLLGIAGVNETAPTMLQSRPTTVPEAVTTPVSPPGSVGIGRFSGICTACHLCVSACPTRVLTPSLLEYGSGKLMQPRLNNHAGFCNYDCTICSQVCPTGAILPIAPEEKRLTQLGVAHFIKDNCVVHTDKTSCGACSEHCPTKAVRMVPYENPLNKPLVIPEVDPDICVGCGACEHACPTRPFRAIYVEGNAVHKRAKKPVVRKAAPAADDSGDFPF
jgi:ferredoxin